MKKDDKQKLIYSLQETVFYQLGEFIKLLMIVGVLALLYIATPA